MHGLHLGRVERLCAVDDLCADKGLRNQNAGADGADAFQRAEFWHDRRRRGPLQFLDPVGELLAKLFDLRFVL